MPLSAAQQTISLADANMLPACAHGKKLKDRNQAQLDCFEGFYGPSCRLHIQLSQVLLVRVHQHQHQLTDNARGTEDWGLAAARSTLGLEL